MKKYIDKNGKEIKAGMKIVIGNDAPEEVYDTTDDFGRQGLGVNASNPEYLKNHPTAEQEFYPLTAFSHVSCLGGIIQLTDAVVEES